MESLFGLRESDLKNIISILEGEPFVEEAIIFGSRAKGNFKNGSDVDIVLKGKGLDSKTINHIHYLLNEETQMPYKFDVLDYTAIANKDLVGHIDRVGISFYRRKDR